MKPVSFSVPLGAVCELNTALSRLVAQLQTRSTPFTFLPPGNDPPRKMLSAIFRAYSSLPFCQRRDDAILLLPTERLQIRLAPTPTADERGGAEVRVSFVTAFPDELSRDLAVNFLCALQHVASAAIRPGLGELLRDFVSTPVMGRELPVG